MQAKSTLVTLLSTLSALLSLGAFLAAVAHAQSSELTDSEIQAAIQRGIDEPLPSWHLLFPDTTSNIVNHAPRVYMRKVGKVEQRAILLSDSDRIALAAWAASHDKNGKSLRNFSFSVQDAKTSAGRLGVTTLILEVDGLGPRSPLRHLQAWVGPEHDPKVILSADDKVIEPLSKTQSLSEVAGTVISGGPVFPLVFGLSSPPTTSLLAVWDCQNYFRFNVQLPFIYSVFQYVYPGIGAEKRILITTIGADGQRTEKSFPPLTSKVAPKKQRH